MHDKRFNDSRMNDETISQIDRSMVMDDSTYMDRIFNNKKSNID